MRCEALLNRVSELRGHLFLDGDRMGYRLPDTREGQELLVELRQNREALLTILRCMEADPVALHRHAIELGVRIVRWEPTAPPFQLNRFTRVTDTLAFIHATMRQLEHRLAGNDLLAGNWSLPELIERLDRAGVAVALDNGRAATR